MRPRIFVIAAGIPPAVEDKFVEQLQKKMEHIRIVTFCPLGEAEGYSESYTEAVYRKFFDKLKKRSLQEGNDVLEWANVVLIFLGKTRWYKPSGE